MNERLEKIKDVLKDIIRETEAKIKSKAASKKKYILKIKKIILPLLFFLIITAIFTVVSIFKTKKYSNKHINFFNNKDFFDSFSVVSMISSLNTLINTLLARVVISAKSLLNYNICHTKNI